MRAASQDVMPPLMGINIDRVMFLYSGGFMAGTRLPDFVASVTEPDGFHAD
jgi:hypothetical protein